MCSLNDGVIEENVIEESVIKESVIEEEETETPADHVIDTCDATLDSLEMNYFYNPVYAQDIVQYLMVGTISLVLCWIFHRPPPLPVVGYWVILL